MSCGKKTQSVYAENEEELTVEEVQVHPAPVEEMGGIAPEGPTNTVIVGRIASSWITEDKAKAIPACQTHPCEAKVEVLRILKSGSDYHGQYEDGFIIPVHFDFTLHPTKDILPELTVPLVGLTEGDVFEAEVRHHDQGPYSIGTYKKLTK